MRTRSGDLESTAAARARRAPRRRTAPPHPATPAIPPPARHDVRPRSGQDRPVEFRDPAPTPYPRRPTQLIHRARSWERGTVGPRLAAGPSLDERRRPLPWSRKSARRLAGGSTPRCMWGLRRFKCGAGSRGMSEPGRPPCAPSGEGSCAAAGDGAAGAATPDAVEQAEARRWTGGITSRP